MKCPIINIDNKKLGDLDLDEQVFGAPIRPDLVARAVRWQLAKRRAGTHKVKTRKEVQATSAKPFRQKGTGRARQGSSTAPQMRGGGVVFGPHPRSHAHSLPKKVRRMALLSALSAKQADGKLVILEAAKAKTAKTADLAKKVQKLGWRSALVIDGPQLDENFSRAARNLMGLDLLPYQGANVYDILNSDILVLTKDAVEKLVERLK